VTDQQPHTPTTEEEIRHDFSERQAGAMNRAIARENFDRMIAAAEQRGAERAWDEGWNAGYFDYVEMIGNDDYQPQNNPYRADRITEQENNHA
jgi:hypothetical protein